VRITHAPHPLVGQTYEVVGLRREGGETSCDVLLADGSRLRLPAHWTDHPAGGARSARSNARATPDALRDLLGLVRALVSSREAVNAQRCPLSQGDEMREQYLLFESEQRRWGQRVWQALGPETQHSIIVLLAQMALAKVRSVPVPQAKERADES
jgi:hypothetical protein